MGGTSPGILSGKTGTSYSTCKLLISSRKLNKIVLILIYVIGLCRYGEGFTFSRFIQGMTENLSTEYELEQASSVVV